MRRHTVETCALALSLATVLAGCAQTPAAPTDQGASEQETTQEEAASTAYATPAPITAGRDEEHAELMLAGHTYTLDAAHKVDGRQGIAVSEDGYIVSGSKTLSVYDGDWNLKKTNDDPFKGIENTVNHLGDIDYYQGEIYAGVENFLDGKAENIQIVVYDADTLEPVRTFPFDPASGQNEVSGIAVDEDNGCVWMCSWADGESGRYLYRYDLEDGTYLGKYHLQAPPQWIQGICYLDGCIYITADDGTADLGECDHVWRTRVNLSSTSWRVTLERTLDDVTMAGEVEGISFDRKNQQMLVSHNRGARIVLGMPQGFYKGYEEEVHEVYVYGMEPISRQLD